MPSPGRLRRLTTIVAADVVGFSRMMAQDEAATLSLVQTVRTEIIEPRTSDHGGRIFKEMGDGLLIEFGSVVDAVNCALEIQQDLRQRNDERPENERALYRIGINIGDVIVEGDDVFGNGVNIAARLEGLADPGGICTTHAVVEHVRGSVRADFASLGTKRLKNIPLPIDVWRIDPPGPEHSKPLPMRRVSRWRGARMTQLLALVVIGLTLSVLGWLYVSGMSSTAPAGPEASLPLPEKPSIAVLPFEDLSDPSKRSSIADGITEDLITDLAKVSGLFVIARNTSFGYRRSEITLQQISKELGVRFILQGSVRRQDDRLRVTAHLVDTSSGVQKWGDRFDGSLSDIFALQDAFVRRTIAALEVELTDREENEIGKPATRSVEAKAAFQEGWELYSHFNARDNALAVPHFERAIALDPAFGRAYAALALVYLRGSVFHWDQALGHSRATLYREMVPRYLLKASEYGTALVHVARAMQYLHYRDGPEAEGANRGTDDARREAGLAIAEQPSDPESHVIMGWALIAAGRPDEGAAFIAAAKRLDPSQPSHYVFFEAAAHAGAGRLPDAAAVLNRRLQDEPTAVDLAPLAASVNALIGNRQSASRWLDLWLKDRDADAESPEFSRYVFPIRWVDNRINLRLHDGLRLAALPIGTTVASLLGAVDASTGRERVDLIRQIGWFGASASPAVPLLIKAIETGDQLTRKEAIIAAGKIGPGAEAVRPLLERYLDQPLIGYHAKQALDQIAAD